MASGANYELTAQHIQDAWPKIQRPDWLVMPLETPIEAVLAAAQMAKAQGVGVILNPAPAQILSVELLSLVDVIIPNEHEAATMTGIALKTDNDIHNAAHALQAKGTGCVIITLGSKGVCVLNNDHIPGTPYEIAADKVDVIDTTAAGDCFVGAFAVGLSERKSMHDAAVFACAAAGLSVTRQGAQPSMPLRTEVERFISERRSSA